MDFQSNNESSRTQKNHQERLLKESKKQNQTDVQSPDNKLNQSKASKEDLNVSNQPSDLEKKSGQGSQKNDQVVVNDNPSNRVSDSSQKQNVVDSKAISKQSNVVNQSQNNSEVDKKATQSELQKQNTEQSLKNSPKAEINNSEIQSDSKQSVKDTKLDNSQENVLDTSNKNPSKISKDIEGSVNNLANASGQQSDKLNGSQQSIDKNSELASINKDQNEQKSSSSESDQGLKKAIQDEYPPEIMMKRDEILDEIKMMYEDMARDENEEGIDNELNVVRIGDTIYLDLGNEKYKVAKIELIYREDSGKFYAIFNSDDMVDEARSILYISSERWREQKEHLIGHYQEMKSFYIDHVNRVKDAKTVKKDLIEKVKSVVGEHAWKDDLELTSEEDYEEFKMIISSNEDNNLEFDLQVIDTGDNYIKIEAKGEVNYLTMTMKAFPEDEEYEKALERLAHAIEEYRYSEFSWMALPNVFNKVLEEIKSEETKRTGDSSFMRWNIDPDLNELTQKQNIIKYKIEHNDMGEEADPDEMFIINMDVYLFKDEFMPSVYIRLGSDVYDSEYLIPFGDTMGEFEMNLLKSVTKTYHMVRKIKWELAGPEEQKEITYDQQTIIEIIKQKLEGFQKMEDDPEVQVETTLEFTGNEPMTEMKVFKDPKMFFTVHPINLEEERTGFLVTCYNLAKAKGSIGEYRIYGINYFDCREDFEDYMSACLN